MIQHINVLNEGMQCYLAIRIVSEVLVLISRILIRRKSICLGNPQEERQTTKFPSLRLHHIMEVGKIVPTIVRDVDRA